jgi:hypothetical protein
MKKYWLFLAVLPIVFISCKDHCIKGDGNVQNNTSRYFDYFDIVQSDIKSNVYIFPVYDTLPDEVFTYCDGNLDPYIKSWVDKTNNTLHIEQDDKNCIRPSKPLEIYVYAHKITGITSNSSGYMYCDSLTSSNLSIQVLGSGSIYMKVINISLISANLSGNGEIVLEGQGITGSYTNWGSGKFTAAQMRLSGNCTATCKGIGNLSLYCHGILTADPGPNGAIIYFYGNPYPVIAPPERVVPGS